MRGVGESKLKGREGGWGRDEDALVAARQWINLEADVEMNKARLSGECC